MKKFIPFTFAGLLLISFINSEYKSYFDNGINLLNKNKYDSSAFYFKKSYNEKIHSKTAYYISLCYFYLNKDSLAEVYAKKALIDPPRIDTLKFYSDRLNAIIDKCDLRKRFKGVHIKVTLSKTYDEVDTKAQDILSFFYSGADGLIRMEEDYYYAQANDLPHSPKSYIDSCDSKYYYSNKLDSVSNNKFRKRNYIDW